MFQADLLVDISESGEQVAPRSHIIAYLGETTVEPIDSGDQVELLLRIAGGQPLVGFGRQFAFYKLVSRIRCLLLNAVIRL